MVDSLAVFWCCILAATLDQLLDLVDSLFTLVDIVRSNFVVILPH
jgi:hypothetical protein